MPQKSHESIITERILAKLFLGTAHDSEEEEDSDYDEGDLDYDEEDPDYNEEHYDYDEEDFSEERELHENYEEAIGKNDPYNRYKTQKGKQVRKIYKIVASDALIAKKKGEKSYVRHYLWSSDLEKLREPLSKMELLPSRFAMYEFLDRYYYEKITWFIYTGKTTEEIGNEEMLKTIWNAYYKIVNSFVLKKHRRKIFLEKVFKKKVNDFVNLLKAYEDRSDNPVYVTILEISEDDEED